MIPDWGRLEPAINGQWSKLIFINCLSRGRVSCNYSGRVTSPDGMTYGVFEPIFHKRITLHKSGWVSCVWPLGGRTAAIKCELTYIALRDCPGFKVWFLHKRVNKPGVQVLGCAFFNNLYACVWKGLLKNRERKSLTIIISNETIVLKHCVSVV